MFRTWRTQFLQEIGLEEQLESGVPGTMQIPVHEGLFVAVSEIPRGFSLFCDQIECPESTSEEFYEHALFANLFGRGTDNAVLGLDLEGKRLTLSREIEYTVDYQEFKDIVEDFLNSVDFWEQEVLAYSASNG